MSFLTKILAFICISSFIPMDVSACYYDFSSFRQSACQPGQPLAFQKIINSNPPHIGVGCLLDPYEIAYDNESGQFIKWYLRAQTRTDFYKICPGIGGKQADFEMNFDNTSKACGSIIKVDNQVLVEQVPIVGTNYSLVYSSDKTLGYKAWYAVRLPVTTATFNPSGIAQSAKVEINIAGRTISQLLPVLSSSMDSSFIWDGLDSNGDALKGSHPITTTFRVTYQDSLLFDFDVYPYEPYFNLSYTRPKEQTVTTKFDAPTVTNFFVGSAVSHGVGFGGWTLDILHAYDQNRKVLFLGNGQTYNTDFIQRTNQFWVVSEDRSEVYLFNAQGRHFRTRDAITGTVKYTFNYSSNSRLISVVDENSKTMSIQYSGGLPISITAPYGQVTTLATDPNGFISSVTNPAGETHEMTYTNDGLLLSFEKPNGVVSTMTYNTSGKLLSDVSSAGSSITLNKVWNDTGYTISEVTELGRTTSHKFSTANGLSRQTTYPDSSKMIYTEDKSSSLSEDTVGYWLASNKQSDTRFGANLYMPKSINRVDGYQNLVSNYIESSTLTDPSDPLSLATLTQTWIANSKTYQKTYNQSSRTWISTSPTGRTSTTKINAKGDVVSDQYASFVPYRYFYDVDGRVSEITQGAARSTTLSYNNEGYLSSITNPLNQTTLFGYDLAGRVVSQTLPDSRVVLFGYDVNGNITHVTPPGKPEHEMTYNGFDLLTSYIPPTISGPSNVTSTYSYNDDKQLIQLTRANSQTAQFNYGAVTNKLDSIYLPTGNRTFNYADGNLSSSNSEDSIYSSFNIRGTVLRAYGISTPTFGYNTSYTHTKELWVDSETLSVGGGGYYDVVTNSYDNDGLLTAIGSQELARSNSTGLVEQITHGDVVKDFTYSTAFGELSTLNAMFDTTQLYREIYVRDALGRISNRKTRYGVTGLADFGYVYDASGRLSEVKLAGVTKALYSYDDNSNRTSQTIDGVTTAATYDDQDRLLTFGTKSFSYNDNGELSSVTDSATSETSSYTYDVMGNLKSVVLPSKTVNYRVDAHDQRVMKLNGTTVEAYYLWNPTKQLIAVANGSGTVTARFVYGSRSNIPDYMIHGGVEYQIVSDHVGSPVLVVNTTTGAIAQKVTYDEFGRVLTDTNPGFTPFGFAGCLYDQDTKLCRFGARDYDAETGRWTAKDPILFAGGDANLYGYTFQDPINFIDAEGTFAFALVPAIIPYVPALITGAKVAGAMAAAYALQKLTSWQWGKLKENTGEHPEDIKKRLVGPSGGKWDLHIENDGRISIRPKDGSANPIDTGYDKSDLKRTSCGF